MFPVTAGLLVCLQVQPKEMAPWSYPATGPKLDTYSGALRRVTGAAWDPADSTLYLLNLHSREKQGQAEQFHVVHAYRLDA
jgi:hypothetical protein